MNDYRSEIAEYVGSKFVGAVDKAGAPYINHCRYVAELAEQTAKKFFPEYPDFAKRCFLVGYCHDVLEDTDTPRDEIVKMIGEENSKVVELLSHPHGGKYDRDEYLRGIKEDICAVVVKYADATHNSNILRFFPSEQTDKRQKLCAKYKDTATDLLNCLLVKTL